jgi:hypothetical protein
LKLENVTNFLTSKATLIGKHKNLLKEYLFENIQALISLLWPSGNPPSLDKNKYEKKEIHVCKVKN